MPDDEPFRLDFAPNVVALYWVENVAILAWNEQATAAVVEALHAAAEPQRKRYPTGMSFVHIGRVQISLMDSATRQVFVRVLREMDTYVAASAIVTRASGFLASTLRSIATGIVVLSRSSVEVRFHEHPRRSARVAAGATRTRDGHQARHRSLSSRADEGLGVSR
jgi:hypothetical protein